MPLNLVHLAANGFEPDVVVSHQGLVTLSLQGPELDFEIRFINTFGMVVHVHINIERLADRGQQMLLVQLCITLNSLMLDSPGDIPQLGDGHYSELFVFVFHSGYPFQLSPF
jgi:hypothetical protein